jgi:hypothetical protein
LLGSSDDERTTMKGKDSYCSHYASTFSRLPSTEAVGTSELLLTLVSDIVLRNPAS